MRIEANFEGREDSQGFAKLSLHAPVKMPSFLPNTFETARQADSMLESSRMMAPAASSTTSLSLTLSLNICGSFAMMFYV